MGEFFNIMSEAQRDENFVTTIQGVSSVDGETPINIEVNPTTNAILVEVA